MTPLEQKEIRGITIKQAASYILTIIGLVASVVLMYQKITDNQAQSKAEMALRAIEINTNRAQIDAIKTEINNLKLQVNALEIRLEDLKQIKWKH